MAQVTVGAGTGEAILNFNVTDRAFSLAQSLASAITSMFGTGGTAYNPASPPTVPAAGSYLYDLSTTKVSIDAKGFAAIVVQNSDARATVMGGGNRDQTVLGSNGGLTFTDSDTNPADGTTVVVGGGKNRISFAGSTGKNAFYAANGSNSIIGGDGATTIDGGTGKNKITLGGGANRVYVDGSDQIQLGAGSATISVDAAPPGASATVYGAVSLDDPGTFSLIFSNGNLPSEVTGGAGSYSINGGNGGGYYTGGWAGNNLLFGGAGSVTLQGGGNGDYLIGSSGQDKLIGGPGSETMLAASGDQLIGGSGNDAMYIVAGQGISDVTLGTGVDTVWAGANARVLVYGETANPTVPVGDGTHFSMLFASGSSAASTVLGGVGSYFVEAGQGGGVFTGGSAGGNVLFSDGGTVTLFGGGKGDYLAGGADGSNYLVAAKGNTTLVGSAGGSDTLVGGSGADTFNLAKEVANNIYTIDGYTNKDLLFIDAAHAASATIPGALQVANGTSTITLSDNTKVVLVGYTGPIHIG